MATKKKGLGKGLDALLGDAFLAEGDGSSVVAVVEAVGGEQRRGSDGRGSDSISAAVSGVQEIPLDLCQRGKYQPRRDIAPDELEGLAASIRQQGVMQPIILRPLVGKTTAYEIIAGERRWRAAQLAGLDTLPAIIKPVSDRSAIAMALIENLQREDLNPVEEALAMSRFQDEFGLTHQQLADALGKSRAAVSNALRLLSLQKEARLMLENGDLDMGHARALLSLEASQQASAAAEVVNRGYNVRQTEALVKKLQAQTGGVAQASVEVDPNIGRLEEDLAEKLGVPVAVQHRSNGAGKITLKYNSLDELDGIISHLKRK